MARKISIKVDTASNWIRFSDYDDQSGHIVFEAMQQIGDRISIERENGAQDLTGASHQIRIATVHGKTGLFAASDISTVDVDGSPVTVTTLAQLISDLAAYLFLA